MLEFWQKLFFSDFMPHGTCYLWNAPVLWLNVISDLVIASAYYTIPAVLILIARKRRDLNFQWVFVAFGVFILACGTTHLMGVWTVWNGTYRLDGVIKAVTAVASIATAIMLIPLTPKVLALESPANLSQVNAALAREIEVRKTVEQRFRALNADLESRVTERTAALTEAIRSLQREMAERVKTEAALEHSEARLRALLECASQGIIAVDEDGTVVLVNAKTEELFGYSRQELQGKTLELLLPAGLGEAHRGHRAEFFAQPRSRPMGLGLELAARRKDQSEFPVEISLSFIAEGRLALALITDISSRKQFEQELRQTQKLESLGVLAGGVAHDFNNLLTGILGNVSFAIDALPDESDCVAVLRQAVTASERAAELVSQLLAYAGKGRITVGLVDLSALVEETTGLILASIPKNAQLVLDLAAHPPAIEGDRSQIQQVIMNLILNAAEALHDRPGIVTVSTSTVITESKKENASVRQVVFRVTDTGCGMSKTTVSRIFDPFFTTKFTGRGLGLAAVQGIVRAHRGAIQVHSEPELGSTFEVRLPAPEDPVVGDPDIAEHIPARPHAGTILVVDDEDLIRNVARLALERRGYRVKVAENGRQAVELLQHAGDTISLVILDLTMPVMSGEEALRRIRRLDADLPVILSSGYSEQEARKRFSDEDVAGFLQKPYRAEAIVQKVSRVLHEEYRTGLRGGESEDTLHTAASGGHG